MFGHPNGLDPAYWVAYARAWQFGMYNMTYSI
jgi:hypothetical protein